jgi:hypothetical protein
MGRLLPMRPVTRELRATQASLGRVGIDQLVVTFGSGSAARTAVDRFSLHAAPANSCAFSGRPVAANRPCSMSRRALSPRRLDA